MSKGKYLLWGLLGVAGIAGGTYLLTLNRLSSELETITRAIIHKVTLTGLVLRVDFTLKNPSSGTVKVKQPYVKMIYGETVFATSVVENRDFQIPQHGEISSLDYSKAQTEEEKAKYPKPIFITLNLLTLAMKVPNMLKEYRSTGKFNIKVETISTINNRLPYKKEESITIGKEA